jgi:hypothetical protein
VVVHGCLLIDVDLARYCRTLDVLAARDCPAGAHGRHIAALRQVAGRVIDLPELADALAGGFAAAGLSSPETSWGLPRPDELDRARALWPYTRSPDPAASREARLTERRHDVATCVARAPHRLDATVKLR